MLSPRIATLYELQAAYMEPKLKAMGISWTTFQMLSAVFGAGGAASQAEIARRLGVTPATLSEAVQTLSKKGFLSQAPSDADRRVKLLKLTAKANKSLQEITKVAQEAEQIAVAGLNDAKLRKALTLLDKCVANLEKALEA